MLSDHGQAKPPTLSVEGSNRISPPPQHPPLGRRESQNRRRGHRNRVRTPSSLSPSSKQKPSHSRSENAVNPLTRAVCRLPSCMQNRTPESNTQTNKQTHYSKPPFRPRRIWLLDLARTLPPTTQLDGFDIDISDCPPGPWLPPNVTMRRLDALGAIPEPLVGAYDIVQLRLFQVVVRDNDPGPLLRNMLTMLSGCSASRCVSFVHVRSVLLAFLIHNDILSPCSHPGISGSGCTALHCAIDVR